MSEYQFFEFAALDRPLTTAEMRQLRAASTRADITPAGFVNAYDHGSLKARPLEWMQRYFDAFVHVSGWGARRFALRLPRDCFSAAALKPFLTAPVLEVCSDKQQWILDWQLDGEEDFERFVDDDGRAWMRRLVPLRAELMRGDCRALYLGWLVGIGALSDDTLEPDVPPGLADLTPAQSSFVEFMGLGPDLLAAAAAGSAAREPPVLEAWLKTWTREEMAAVIEIIALERTDYAAQRVHRRYAAWQHQQRASRNAATPRRRVAQLRSDAESLESARHKREAAERSATAAARQRAREAKLRQMMQETDIEWAALNVLVGIGTAAAYERATQAIKNFGDAYALLSRRDEFDLLLSRFLHRHSKRAALFRRLTEAGVWSSAKTSGGFDL